MYISKMLNADYMPLEFDVLLTDVHARDLRHDISNRLGIPYLSECDDNSASQDINGIIWGPHNRLFVSMKVTIPTTGSLPRMKHVHMIMDTGSPQTYLCSDVFAAFNRLIPNPGDPISVNINGTRLSVLESPAQSHFNEVNLLGADYLRTTNARVNIDFSINSVHISIPF